MIEAVNYLAERNDIVVDDLSFLNPGDQRSAVSVNSAKALNNPDWPVRALVTSVGNYATRHYEGVFEPSEEGLGLGLPAAGTTHQFRASEETTDALNRGPLSWNEFFLRSGQQAIIALFWNDPWSDTKNDYDLYLLDLARPAGNRVVASSRGSQEGERGQVPREIIDFTNNGPEGFFAVVVQNWESRAPTKAIEIYVTSNSLLPGYATVLNLQYQSGERAGAERRRRRGHLRGGDRPSRPRPGHDRAVQQPRAYEQRSGEAGHRRRRSRDGDGQRWVHSTL